MLSTILLSPTVTTAAQKATEKMGFFEMIAPPEDISVHGHKIDWLFNYTTSMNVFFFVLVCLGQRIRS